MLQFKQFILESNFNQLPSYIADQIKKIITDYIDSGCQVTVYNYSWKGNYVKPLNGSSLGHINIKHLNGGKITQVPIKFSNKIREGGMFRAKIVPPLPNGDTLEMWIEISLIQFQDIQNDESSISNLYSVLVHETQHAVDRFREIFKNKKKYFKAIKQLDHADANGLDPLPAYKKYVQHPIELSAISSEIYHSITEYYSKLKTKSEKQLFLEELEVFIKSDNIYNTYFAPRAKFNPPIYFDTEFFYGLFKSLTPNSKIYKKVKVNLLNLYNNLRAQSNIT